ncbi:short-chain dehydrogenase/reductase [Hypoxylon rubiginosum]|uniref:Short-chain dehydrogenase/reductase n=1 Tax=Hypoxylon rubiginosum TaxID=110542 RepID=A0ACC0CM12_9PEZI|nr:short-chain dehydrogenase/reductase [Hypoxylon rubiginosum]
MTSLRKYVLITGCSAGGIGAGLAEVFREKGYHVFATLRNPSKLPQTLSKVSNVTPLTLDVLSSESIAAAVKTVSQETGGRLDVLVNNSGQTYIMPALDVDLNKARNLFDLNFFAPLAMIQAFAPLLIEARGIIVNQSSAAAYVPMSFSSVYNGSKAALTMATDTWGRELQPLGVRTLTLITTGVKTHAFDNIERPKVPESSYYYVIRDYIVRMSDGRLQEGAPDTRTYALKVVGAVQKGTTGEIWVGKDASINHWALRLLPSSVFDLVLDGFLKVSGELAKVAESMKSRR